MINWRLYRAAFVPFLFALALAAFSLSPRPLPLTSTLAPDAFLMKGEDVPPHARWVGNPARSLRDDRVPNLRVCRDGHDSRGEALVGGE